MGLLSICKLYLKRFKLQTIGLKLKVDQTFANLQRVKIMLQMQQ